MSRNEQVEHATGNAIINKKEGEMENIGMNE